MSAMVRSLRIAALALGCGPLLLATGDAEPQALAETIAGTLVVDGGPPREPIEVRLTTTAGRIDAAPRTTTDASGAFRFDGASADWKGELRFPLDYAIEFGGDRVVLERPAVDLVIRLVSSTAPAIVGRVLDPHLQPVIDAQGTVEATCSEKGRKGQSSIGFWTGEGGVFRGPIQPCAGTPRFVLEVWKPGMGYAALKLDDVDPAVGRDVGDLVLEPETELLVHVVSEGGESIEDAVVATDDPRWVSEPANPGGYVALVNLRRGVSELIVAGPGHVSARVPLPERRPASIEVVLAKGATLIVHAVDESGERAPVVVYLSATEMPIDFPSPWPDWLPSSPGFTHSLRDGATVEAVQEFHTDAGGDLVLNELRPDMELGVTVRDRFVRILGARTVVMGREPVELTFVVPPARWLSGRVVDTTGRPLEGARICPGGGKARCWSTDSDGRFTIPHLRAEAALLAVRMDGFATRWLEEVPVSPEGGELEIVLERGHAIDLEIVDAEGSPVTASHVQPFFEGRKVGSVERDDDGRWRLTELPTGLLTIEAWVDDEVHRVQSEAAAGAVVIRLPR